MSLVELIKEQKVLLEELNRKLSEREGVKSGNQLLTVSQVLTELGLKSNDAGWTFIRKTLIEKYGMSKQQGMGLRIRRKNLEKFLSERF